jgi:hypothetical protein
MESSLDEIHASELIMRFEKIRTEFKGFRVGLLGLEYIIRSSLAE